MVVLGVFFSSVTFDGHSEVTPVGCVLFGFGVILKRIRKH